MLTLNRVIVGINVTVADHKLAGTSVGDKSLCNVLYPNTLKQLGLH